MSRVKLTPEEKRERRRARERGWRAANLEKARERDRLRRAADPEKARAKDREKERRRKADPARYERHAAQKAEWAAKNPEKMQAAQDRFYAKLRAAAGPKRPEIGILLAKQLSSNDIYAAAWSAVPRTIPADVRDDVISMIILAVLEGEIRIEDVPRLSREFTNRHYRQFSKFDTSSLDAPLYHDSSKTLLDTLTTENAVLL